MLSTGIRTPLGIKVLGPDLKIIQQIGENIEGALRGVPGTAGVFAERSGDGYYLDIDFKREELARYGISIDEANMIVSSAIGGENITTTVEGRARYPVNIRFARDYRDDLGAIDRLRVTGQNGAQVPLSQIASIKVVEGPSMIRNENGMLAGFVLVDTKSDDIGGYIHRAREAVNREVITPAGYTLVWSGQFENMERVRERMTVMIPVTLCLVAFLLYLNTRSAAKAGIVLLAVPFSLVGSVWLLYFLGYNISVAVWIGLIALMGLDAETGVFMLMYIDMAYDERKARGQLLSVHDLKEAIIEGAVKRIRPKMMTVMAAFVGLLPIMFSSATGSDVLKRIAAPMVGGLVTSFALELLVYPAIYLLWKKRPLSA